MPDAPSSRCLPRAYREQIIAALKLLWLALQNTFANTTRFVREWHEAMNHFAIFYGDRFTRPA